ncbi:putative Maternal effect embryo arrest 22 [Melia azedarach]|uniref:Maternal effect embryo arrest 22 n=1 Tax=Melia azedarach TaxID=155640 RepID=A0ACC1WV42_MELAZ|nr:putative Maternal effect embryo arrest 22 [Melia azedarach]
MAANVAEKQEPLINPCCRVWRDRYLLYHEKRNALNKAVKLLEPRLDKLEAENLSLKKACEEERSRAQVEQDRREKESAARVLLENEISALKSEISMLQQKSGSDARSIREQELLEIRIGEGEKKIERLKEVLEKEKARADLEKKNAQVEKKNAAEAWKCVEAEKGKANEERRHANIEAKKAEKCRLQLETLRKEADGAKSKLISEASKSEEIRKSFEAEKQKVNKERKRADSEMAKVEEQRKLAEASRKQAEEEKCRSEIFSQQLEEARQRIGELQKEIQDLMSRYSGKTRVGNPDKSRDAVFSKMNNGCRLDRLERVGGDLNLGLEIVKFNETSKGVEVGKEKAISEKKLSNSEIVKSQGHRKLADLNRKKTMEDSFSADQQSLQFEEARGRIDELQNHIHYLRSSRKASEASAVPPDQYLVRDSEKVKLLKKQLKFEKMQGKHAKKVAKWEKNRNSILRQELRRLKLDFVQFLHRLDVVDKCFSPNAEGIDNLGREKVRDCSNMQILKLKEKLYDVEPLQMYLQCKNELPKPCCMDVAAASPLRETLQHIAPSLSLAGGICSESISGIDSKDPKLESLLGGSSRKMLQSCAINSSSASFSDRQLMGSQGRGSVTTSSKLIEESLNAQGTNSSVSGEVNRMRCDGKLALDAENSVRSPPRIGGTGKTNGSSRKRKRILDVIESIELLHSEDRKLHSQIEEKLSDLYSAVNKQTSKLLEEGNYAVHNLQDISYLKHERLPKKKKVSHKENLGPLFDGGEPKGTQHVGSKVHDDARVFKQISKPSHDLIGTAQAWTEGISDSDISHLETLMNFDEGTTGDYMKLLDLDNPVDEECYRTAMEMPLSPTLPEIEFRAVETSVSDKFEPLLEERLYGGLSEETKNLVLSHGYDVINVEIISNEMNNNASENSHNSLLYKNEGPLDSCDAKVNHVNVFCSTVQAEKACDNQAQDFEVEGIVSDLCRSGDEGVKFAFESELGPAHDNIPEYLVVFHNIKEKDSISRILRATKTCKERCSLAVQTEWILQKILLALRMEEHLLSREKACVFFSLLLLNFSTAAWENATNSLNSNIVRCLDSFASHVTAVMSNAEARSVFDKLCLDELLGLIEDFLVDGEIMQCTNVSSETMNRCDSKINIFLDGVNVTLSVEAASAAQLVAGSIILASISAATDQIGFICEASYNIFRMRQSDTSLVLMILHIFAYLGGEKIFTSRKYYLTMTMLKSVITCLEGGCLSVGACSSISSSEVRAKFHPCAECPFSKDAVSVEIAMSLLLEKLWSYAVSGTMNLLPHEDQAEQSFPDPYCLRDVNCGASCLLNKCEMPSFQSNAVVDMTLCHATDVLSLVELLAYIMRWEWTCTTVVPELLRLLESPTAESFTIAIVILLSQLGRLGVDACGYEDKNVEILRNRLSAFLERETTSRAGLPLQIASVSALLGLLSLDFDQINQINTMCPSTASQSVSTDTIRKWFSSLSNENKALSFSLLQSSALVRKLR